MNLRHLIVPRGRHRTRSATLIRRSTARASRRPERFWLLVIVVAVVIAGAVGLLLSSGAVSASIAGALLAGDPIAQADPIVDGSFELAVRSQPAGARIVLDGRERGRTPLVLHTTYGSHRVVLQADGVVDATEQVEVGPPGAVVDAMLWRRHPAAIRLRPAYPGALLADAGFLPDGRVTLTIALPDRQPGQSASILREAWLIDPASRSDAAQSIGAVGPRAPEVAVSPDGRRIAMLGDGPRAASPAAVGGLSHLDTVRAGSAGDRTSTGTPIFHLAPSSRTTPGATGQEQLAGLVWLPDNQHLLVADRLGDASSGGVVRTRLLVVDAGREGAEQLDPSPVELIVLPADVLLPTADWSPDGRRVALLARASSAPGSKSLLGLGVLNLGQSDGDPFVYLADLGGDASGVNNLIAPVAWEPCARDERCATDERLLYAAAVPGAKTAGRDGPLGLLGLNRSPGTTPGGLFVSTPSVLSVAAGDPPRLGSATGTIGLAWRSPGSGIEGAPLVGLTRSASGAFALSAIDPSSGRMQDLGVQFPTEFAPGTAAVGVRWDIEHARALVLARPSDRPSVAGANPVDVWLVDFGRGQTDHQ